MQVTVINQGDTIAIQSPYNAGFIKDMRHLDGKWNKPYWVIPARWEGDAIKYTKELSLIHI